MDTIKKEIYLLAQQDATVAAYVALYKHSDMSYSNMLEQLVINLQAEKDCYFKQTVKLLRESPPKPQIIEQSDSAEKAQPKWETNTTKVETVVSKQCHAYTEHTCDHRCENCKEYF